MSESRRGVRQLSTFSFLVTNSPNKFYVLSLENLPGSTNGLFRVIQVKRDMSLVFEGSFNKGSFGFGGKDLDEECRKICSCLYNYGFEIFEEENSVKIKMNGGEIKLNLISKEEKEINQKADESKEKIKELNNTIELQNKKLEEFSNKEKYYSNKIEKFEQVANNLYLKLKEQDKYFKQKISELTNEGNNINNNNFNNNNSNNNSNNFKDDSYSNPYRNNFNNNSTSFTPTHRMGRERNMTNFY